MQIKKIITALFLLVSTVTYSQLNSSTTEQSSFQLNVSADKNGTCFTVWINNPEKKNLRVQIKSNLTGIVMDTVTSEEQFGQRYNLNEAEDGRYTVIVKCGKEKCMKEVELNTILTRQVKVN